ncbi:MAG TPA: hypothetical protein VLC71_05305 [Thermomonas sp.]|nr:hypothetical protein [Thermomonas sp.]
MTMVICKECKAQTSTLAVACLHCGATRRSMPNYAAVAVAFLGLTLLSNTWLLWRLYELESRANAGGIAHDARGRQGSQ